MSSKCLNFACVIVSITVRYASVKYYAFGCKTISADSLFLLMVKGIYRFNRTVVFSKCLKCFCMTFYYSGEKKCDDATSTVDTYKIDAIFLENIFDLLCIFQRRSQHFAVYSRRCMSIVALTWFLNKDVITPPCACLPV